MQRLLLFDLTSFSFSFFSTHSNHVLFLDHYSSLFSQINIHYTPLKQTVTPLQNTEKFTWLSLIFSVRIIHATEYNISKTEPGFIFEANGQIELISGTWSFVTNINLTTYFNEISYARDLLAKTKEQCKALQTADIQQHFGDIDGICNGTTAELTHEINDIRKRNQYFIHQRSK